MHGTIIAVKSNAVTIQSETGAQFVALVHSAFRDDRNKSRLTIGAAVTIGANFDFESEIASTGHVSRASMRDNRRAAVKFSDGHVIGVSSIGAPRSTGAAVTSETYADLF